MENIIIANMVMSLCNYLQRSGKMTRTTVMLPEKTKRLAMQRARQKGVSFGEFVRESLEKSIAINEPGVTYSREADSLFSGMKKIAEEAKYGVSDGSINHDAYLYGSGFGESK